MKKVFKGLVVAAVVTMSAGVCLTAAADTAKLDQLLEQVKKSRTAEGKINQQREQEFLCAIRFLYLVLLPNYQPLK